MNPPPKVSVILTSYNHAKYLHDAIDSVLAQTFSDFEIIIWDDASVDASWEIINDYSDPRIRVFRNETNLRFGNVNRALEQTAGEYIAIHHSDDVWEADKLEKQVAFLNENPQIGAVFSNAFIIGENGEPFEDTSHFYYKIFEQPNRSRHEWLNYFFYKGNALCHPSVLIRKTCYDDCGLYRYGLAHPDFDMWVRLCLKYEIQVLPEKLIRFRVRSNEANTSGNRPEVQIRANFGYLQIYKNYLSINDRDDFLEIFPESAPYFETEDFDIPYALAMMALNAPFNFGRLFALQLLFDLVQDPARAQKIQQIYGFGYQKLFELTSRYDVFSVVALSDFSSQLAERDQQLAERDQQLAERDQQLAERDQQLAERDRQLAEKGNELSEIYRSRSWRAASQLRRIRKWLLPSDSLQVRVLSDLAAFLRSPIAASKNLKNLSLIRSSGLFNESWYLDHNPDVSHSGIDPAYHYLHNGGYEGRDPGPYFSGGWYLNTYEDVKTAGINPLVHYLRFGREEGRKAQPDQVVDMQKPQSTAVQGEQPLHYGQTGNYRFISLFRRAFRVYRQEGLQVLFRKVVKPLQSAPKERYIPKVSIVIPVFNAVELTKACLESVYRETSHEMSFEVVVIDNASQDKTPRYLNAEKEKYAHLNVIRMEKNIGFGPAVNYGIQHSEGEFIVVLNNDTIVSPGWLDNLLAPLENDPSIGIISPVTNYVGEGPQIDDGAKDLPPQPIAIARYARSIASRSEVVYEPNRLVFFCVLLKRELVDLIGYLDEGYEKGNFEDDDYCMRARMAGYELAIAKNSFVYHHGTVTFKKNRISHSQYMERNREHFYKKAGRIATYHRYPAPHHLGEKHEVSVIIRTKDRPALLQRALTSMANQTFKDFEVVLVNDGGEDVGNLLNSFEKQFHIQYVRNVVSKGRTSAINTGFENSAGRWISYLDDDDILYPWHLESLFLAADGGKNKFVYSDYNRAVFLDSKMITPALLTGAPTWEYSRKELLIQNHIPIHTWLYAHECAEKVGLWDESLDRLEDYEFLIRLSANYSFYHLKKVTCEYRYYIDSANSIYTDRHKTLKALEQIYQQNPVDDSNSLVRRQEILDAIKSQIQKIQQIQSKIGISVSEDIAIREIIRVVVGL